MPNEEQNTAERVGHSLDHIPISIKTKVTKVRNNYNTLAEDYEKPIQSF